MTSARLGSLRLQRGFLLYQLFIFLLVVASVIFAALYIDVSTKNAELEREVERLTEQQVLIMVPDEQAADIANWMKNHPEQTQAIVDMAHLNKQKVENALSNEQESGPTQASHSPINTTAAPVNNKGNSSSATNNVISENADGVKVISLPNGGILVTTRELNETSKNTKN